MFFRTWSPSVPPPSPAPSFGDMMGKAHEHAPPAAVIKYRNKLGQLSDTPEEALAKERKWGTVKVIRDLMDDGGSMMHRFMDAGQCALWIEEHRAELLKVLR